jgi:quinol monooxygenase YgiN
MAEAEKRVKRVLHMKIRALGDPDQVLALMKNATPFFSSFGGAQFRFLQNVDDPARFLIEIEYKANAAIEVNRQKVASDPMVQTFLAGWRQLLAGNAEMDVYDDVTG